MLRKWQLGFNEPGSAVQEGIISFHNDIMLVMIFVVVFVLVMLGRIVKLFRKEVNLVEDRNVHGSVIEVIWSCIPSIILMVVAVPSFTLLYAIEEAVDCSMTVKVIGNQWYWSYEYSDIEGSEVEFDSYMVSEDELEVGELRLLEVDNRMVLPVGCHVRIVVTASDVLHSFAVPGLGIKVDGCVGRLNEVNTFIKRIGVYYGQCSELCGINHSFMPVAVEAVEVEEFMKWLGRKVEDV